jgi:hypothetical protein
LGTEYAGCAQDYETTNYRSVRYDKRKSGASSCVPAGSAASTTARRSAATGECMRPICGNKRGHTRRTLHEPPSTDQQGRQAGRHSRSAWRRARVCRAAMVAKAEKASLRHTDWPAHPCCRTTQTKHTSLPSLVQADELVADHRRRQHTWEAQGRWATTHWYRCSGTQHAPTSEKSSVMYAGGV